MTSISLLTLLLTLAHVRAVDYVFSIRDGGVLPCPGREDDSLSTFFDSDHLEFEEIDDETIGLNGYTILKKPFNPNSNYEFRVKAEESKNGRWVETPFRIDRENVCSVFLDKKELWYDLFKDFTGDARECPPKKGTKYEFNNKAVKAVFKNLAPGIAGFYKLTATLTGDGFYFCSSFEGDLIRVQRNNVI